MRKYIFIFILASFLLSTGFSYADTASGTGFIPGQIWYSEPLVEGNTVKIYTAIWNGDKDPITVHVEFYDSKVILGSRDLTVEPSKIQEVSVSWKVTSGDHIISAKISSSSITTGGKKENITLDNAKTIEDHTFVPVSTKKEDGTDLKSVDVMKNEITKATTALKDVIPESVGTPIASSLGSIDAFRGNTYTKILDTKIQTQKEIDALEKKDEKTSSPDSKTTKSETTQAKPLDATDKPITYVKLFLFSLLSFIFGSKIVFYGIAALLIFIIIRFIFRKIRRR